jgi:hypothetical protein
MVRSLLRPPPWTLGCAFRCRRAMSEAVGSGPRGQSIALHKPAWSHMLTLATDPRHDKSWASRTAPECKPATRDRVRLSGAEMLGPVRSTDEPEDGADERAEDRRPYESLHGIGFDDDHLTPVCTIGENLYDRS